MSATQLAVARLSRATYSLMVSPLLATATVVGIVVRAQIPSATEVLGVGLVVAAVATHRERGEREEIAALRLLERRPEQRRAGVAG